VIININAVPELVCATLATLYLCSAVKVWNGLLRRITQQHKYCV
jgi:hypothetical protein